MSPAVLCEGCGRPAGAREVYCAACGRQLPGREAPAGSAAAPPGWLVAADARGEGGFFEPLPSVPVSTTDPMAPARDDAAPGWRVRQSAALTATPAPPPLPPPAPAPHAAAEASAPGDAAVAALVVPARRPPLRALYVPLLTLVLLSSCGAVALLVLHVALHR